MIKKAKELGVTEKKLISMLAESPAANAVTASIASIVLGLIFGMIVLLIINPGAAFGGLMNLLTAGFSSVKSFSKVLYNAAPLLMTGLAVGFAFKAGLFNIGAAGQYIMGAFFALFTAVIWQFPWWAAILAAMVGGALWGSLPGIFKAFFNVNEVITSIMFNWIGLYLVNLLLNNTPDMLDTIGNKTIELPYANPGAILPNFGLAELINSSYLNMGILIAIIFSILIYIILEKTTLGYEIKACGLNRNASIYAGIDAKRNIILSMIISGALAGIGGGIAFLSGTVQLESMASTLNPMGFNGIPVALLAFSNPLGIIASSLFIAYLQVGGEAMYPEFSSEMVNIILSVIIYFSAFSLIMRSVIGKWMKRLSKTPDALPIVVQVPVPAVGKGAEK
jgi:ABC-type uncharacterized transport system permease subunit